jgi:tetratricopeptide (TPR) repeat protein
MTMKRIAATVIGGLALTCVHLAHASPAEKLGTVDFANSCSAAVQPQFARGVALLHSFWYSEAIKTFDAVIAADPACAIAHWGTAVALFNNPFVWPLTGPALPKGWAAVQRATAANAATQRERDYVGAVEAFYKDSDKVDHRTRALAYVAAMEQITRRYPEDTEGAVFYALSLIATALPGDKNYANQLKAAGILEKVFVLQPSHPGVAHYLIHSYDFPAIAAQGLPAARRYASIAPDAPHALHMPGHIFTRLGLWDESIETNLRSAKVAENHAELVHAWDYLAYAYLQQGRDGDAKRLVDRLKDIGPVNNKSFVAGYAFATIPARYALERDRWADAAKLDLYPGVSDFPWKSVPQAEAQLVFARAIGAARMGDAASARKDIERLQALREAVVQLKLPYWPQQLDIQIKAAAAWATYAEGNKQEALTIMRASAELESASEKHPVSPGYLLPARELLGDMLVEMNQPALALQAYESCRNTEPNRYRGLAGLARAAALSGDRAKAMGYYEELLKLAEKSDSGRPELRQAKAFLARN